MPKRTEIEQTPHPKFRKKDITKTKEFPDAATHGKKFQVTTYLPKDMGKLEDVVVYISGRNSMEGLSYKGFMANALGRPIDWMDRAIQHVTTRRLLRQGFGVIAVSQPNFVGGTREEADANFKVMASDLAQRTNALNTAAHQPRKNLLAVSAGKPVGLAWAEQTQEEIAATLIVPAVYVPSRRSAIPDQTRVIGNLNPKSHFEIVSSRRDGHFPDADTRREVGQISARVPNTHHRVGGLPHLLQAPKELLFNLNQNIRGFNQRRRAA